MPVPSVFLPFLSCFQASVGQGPCLWLAASEALESINKCQTKFETRRIKENVTTWSPFLNILPDNLHSKTRVDSDLLAHLFLHCTVNSPRRLCVNNALVLSELGVSKITTSQVLGSFIWNLKAEGQF